VKGSAINWCDNTFNGWEGCTRVSPGCDHCYAETRDGRHMTEPVDHWGKGAPRRVMSDVKWREPLKWDREAAESGTRPRVFCASLGDWADSEAPAGQRERLWALIRETPNLDWLLLTKRAGNIRRMLPPDWGVGYPNVWLGVTVENRQHGLPRLDVLRSIPAAVRFASIEPLLEDLGTVDFTGINWAIIGGETGSGARSMDTEWVAALIEQCRAQGVAPWVKQLGKLPSDSGARLVVIGDDGKASANAEDWSLWPEHLAQLKVRELPLVDRDEIGKGLHEAELGRIASELGLLAVELEPNDAANELKLRVEYISAERRLFLTRLERGQILAGYKALYGPLRKWSEFLRVIGVARRTAYDLLGAVDEAEASVCAETAQSRFKRRGSAGGYDFDTAVDKAEASLNRIFKGLTETQRQQALDALVNRLGAPTGIRLAA
jgi:protein gp37